METEPRPADWLPRLVAIASAASGDDAAHDLQHLQRVWSSAQLLLARAPGADALVVMAACFLHDLVNLPKDAPDRAQASKRSAQLARHQLAWLGFPADKLDAVAHAIEAHSFSAAITPTTLEAQLVQDADRLDALGAVGLARMFYISGRLGRALAHPTDPLALHRPRNDMAYALDHIEEKLAQLPAMMQTAAGRELAQERLQLMLAFRDAFVAEWSQAHSPAQPSDH
ncbi:HD domain-containing protein [Massilia sp. S19_KUP03_FR1]|uniref:HD domain-containing protein n=1 Tax=Massilia sp. S19_KUP03_FR1 TaxID=3025503 RepID=UPI002FCDBC23